MQFDQVTQTYRGIVEPYRWNAEEQGQIFTAYDKPLQVTPDWIAPSYLNGFASYWQDQPRNEGNWESFAFKPWAYMGQTRTRTALNQTTDGALHQLIQAMAVFAPAGAGNLVSPAAGTFSVLQIIGVGEGN